MRVAEVLAGDRGNATPIPGKGGVSRRDDLPLRGVRWRMSVRMVEKRS